MSKRSFPNVDGSIPCKPTARGYLSHALKIDRLMIDRHNAKSLSENELGDLAEGLLDVDVRLSTHLDLEFPEDSVISKELNRLQNLLRKLSTYPNNDDSWEEVDASRQKPNRLNSRRLARRKVERLHLKDQLGNAISIHDWFEVVPQILELLSPITAEVEGGYLEGWHGDKSEPRPRRARESWLKGEELPTLFQVTYPDLAFGGSGPEGDGYVGPAVTFIQEAMRIYGYNDVSAISIRDASSDWRGRNLSAGKLPPKK